jgi:hypothetical protein
MLIPGFGISMCRTSVTAALLAAATIAAASALPRPARAADTGPPPPVTPFIDSGNTLPAPVVPPRPPLGPWYGWQIAAADLGTVLCVAASRSKICAVPFLLSGPIVHLAHHRPGLAGASLGLRALLPVLGAFMAADNPCKRSPPPPPMQDQGDGFFASAPSNWLCFPPVSAKGALVGAGIAAAADAAIGWARGAAPEEPRRIEPQVSVGQTGFSLGFGAAF